MDSDFENAVDFVKRILKDDRVKPFLKDTQCKEMAKAIRRVSRDTDFFDDFVFEVEDMRTRNEWLRNMRRRNAVVAA
jgi:hypothetical protein